jgi:hypothetical protein
LRGASGGAAAANMIGRGQMFIPSATAQWIQELTKAAYVFHIGGGTVGFASGLVALTVAKGGRLHRLSGTVFLASMLIMAAFAIVLAIVIPDQRVNIFIGALALYLITTSWMAVRRKQGTIGLFEKFSTVVAFILWAPFAILAFQLAAGMTPLFKSAVPFKGPVLIAVYVFAGVLGIAAISDLRMIVAGGISGRARIARHLWRMCLAFTMAAGSFFTNALPHLLPGIYHVTPLSFAPQILLLGLLVFWLVRVRLAGWYKIGTNIVA